MAVNAKDLSRPHVWQPSQNVATARTLLLLHGTGADERDLLGLGRLLDPDANLLSPRGLVRAFGMNRYFMRFDDGSFDEAAIKQNADELADRAGAGGEAEFLAVPDCKVAHAGLLIRPAGAVVADAHDARGFVDDTGFNDTKFVTAHQAMDAIP